MKYLRLIVVVGLVMGAVAQAQPSDSGRFNGYLRAKPALGENAPDFSLRDLDGKEVHLKDLVGKRPIVMEFGSYS
jgi:cytochrome oxidase Cu insertion factor (SCO1/SenC/PrrC family)